MMSRKPHGFDSKEPTGANSSPYPSSSFWEAWVFDELRSRYIDSSSELGEVLTSLLAEKAVTVEAKKRKRLPLLDSSTLEIEQPNEQIISLNATNNETNLSFTPTERGIYTIRWPNSTQPPIQFAVNLFAPTESHIAPVPDLALNTSGTSIVNANESELAGEGQREIWRPLLLLGLLVLMIEWMVYEKDALIRLRTRLAGR